MLFIIAAFLIPSVINGSYEFTLEPATPLFQAIEDGDIDRVRQLIAEGADVNEARGDINFKLTALQTALEKGHYFIAALLAVAGAEGPDDGGNRVMLLATLAGEVEAVRYLAANGVSVDGDIERPLIYAIKHDQERMTEVLLELDAFPSAVDRRGISALMFAAERGSLSSVNLLLTHGADVNHFSLIHTETAISVVRIPESSLAFGSDIVRALLDGGALPGLLDVRGSSTIVNDAISGLIGSDDSKIDRLFDVLVSVNGPDRHSSYWNAFVLFVGMKFKEKGEDVFFDPTYLSYFNGEDWTTERMGVVRETLSHTMYPEMPHALAVYFLTPVLSRADPATLKRLNARLTFIKKTCETDCRSLVAASIGQLIQKSYHRGLDPVLEGLESIVFPHWERVRSLQSLGLQGVSQHIYSMLKGPKGLAVELGDLADEFSMFAP